MSVFVGAGRTALASLSAFLCACQTDAGGSNSLEASDVDSSDFIMSDSEALATIIAERSDEDRARDKWRHPEATLAFFGVKHDDFVVEALPGSGWYTRILLPYVADEGRYAAVNYPYEMFPVILPNPTEEILLYFQNWSENFRGQAADWANPAKPILAFEFGDVPQSVIGKADVLLLIRTMHNFNRAGGGYRDMAVTDAYAMLKPGGTLGVVQHRAAADATGAAADGSNGYLREADVIAIFEEAGFVFEASTDINANPADQPGADGVVWRLPPTYIFGDENHDVYAAIGESDRMTLRFRKPAE